MLLRCAAWPTAAPQALSGQDCVHNNDAAVEWKVARGCPNENFVCALGCYPAMLRRIEDGERPLVELQAYRFRLSRVKLDFPKCAELVRRFAIGGRLSNANLNDFGSAAFPGIGDIHLDAYLSRGS